MTTTSKWIEIATTSIPIFANDGIVDESELNGLMDLALEDGEIDEDEKRVLACIFDKVNRRNASPNVWNMIADIRQKYGI